MLIDLVYTWVDGNDPAHRKLREAYGGPVENHRWRHRDELRYSLRSVALYAPWVNTIHLVTNGQIPVWLHDHPKIRLVTHEEIFPRTDDLPTFNSVAIESHLHRIPDLAEHFLYANDDTLLLKPVQPTEFYTPSGRMKLGTFRLPLYSQFGDPTTAGIANGVGVLQAAFPGRQFFSTDHHINPYTKGIFRQAEEKWPEVFRINSNNRFRSFTDVAFNAAVLPNLAVQTRQGFWTTRDTFCVLTGDRAGYQRVLRERPTFWCINDTGSNDEGLGEVLEALYPDPCEFERA